MSVLPKSFRETIGLSPSNVKISSNKSALIVIDSQGTYSTGSPLEISNFKSSQVKIAEVVEKYRKSNGKIVWIQHSAGAGAPIFDDSREESFGFCGENKPINDEKIIIKKAPSS